MQYDHDGSVRNWPRHRRLASGASAFTFKLILLGAVVCPLMGCDKIPARFQGTWSCTPTTPSVRPATFVIEANAVTIEPEGGANVSGAVNYVRPIAPGAMHVNFLFESQLYDKTLSLIIYRSKLVVYPDYECTLPKSPPT